MHPCSALRFAVALALPALSLHAEPADLPLDAITLYSSGVGHYRHAGAVPAGGEVTLNLDAEELNDALKSLTVGGLGGSGGVSVSYPGQAGVDQRLAAFGVDVRGVGSRAALLDRLRGVPVTVTLGTGEARSGRVLAVEEREVSGGDETPATSRRVLTLVSGSGIVDVDLEKVGGLTIEDERLAGELKAALELLASQRDTRTKPLTLTFADAAEDARVSYLARAPLWKLSYRLDLSGDDPLLQGWAIVDNPSDRDWDAVGVTLVSGRPMSFVQDLYTPAYLERPVVEPERFAGLEPEEHGQGSAEGFAGAEMDAMAVPETAPMEPALLERSRVSPSRRAPAAAGLESLAPAAEAADLGQLFAYTLAEPVTLARGASAMLPVLDAAIEAEAVSVFNAGVLEAHPLRGVRLKNTTELKLDAGPVTVLDGGAYAGDARLGFLAPGDDRLITYAVDLEVTATSNERSDSTRVGASFDRGVLVLRVRDVLEHRVGFRNAAGDARKVLVEVRREPNFEWAEPAGDVETLIDRYRFPLAVPAGGDAEAVARQVRTRSERVSLVGLDGERLDRLALGGGVEPAVAEKLEEAAALRRVLSEAERAVEAADAERQRIAEEQERIRENLRPLDRDSALRQRYVDILDRQEDRLAALVDERAAAAAAVEEARDAFLRFVAGLGGSR
ncbi:hypothetical protein [Phycisphaera mikurensis]|uniref:DUF4139 domain-containing protein n=1 Tax=Phycisphaera mikurensis (strain NBRC 102666 / KCTC 22515 / FYK2301M01) TaxID=1142394 RepID=I0IEF7_PHYMF|nr:hypothetical protein [Phycisphaera mikurensis]MBB6441444.1 hypothetical protein [Phycisphaera mikurensis]BAM03645.1 hypothetical protein PSMK_14860 [Phycisphaera mikurensis NBRC 102666]